MLMRYHYGLGVGHIYAHSASTENAPEHNLQNLESEEVGSKLPVDDVRVKDVLELEQEGDDIDFGSDSEDSNGGETDDDELLAMDEMYGPY